MRSLLALLVVVVTACAAGPDSDEDFLATDVTEEATLDDKADQQPIAFAVVDGLQLKPTIGRTEEGRVIRSASAFRAAFGAAVVAPVDFADEWLAVYSAGERPTGGYGARVLAVRLSDTGKTVKVTAELTRPGDGCTVTQAITKPYVVVKFAAQPSAGTSRFTKLVATQHCTSPLCGAELTARLAAQVEGMTYTSESDYPLTVVAYPGAGAPTIAKLRALTSTPAATVIEQRTFASVMGNLTTVWDPADPYSIEYAARYQALRDLLEAQLANLTVIRIGTISIDVYFVGLSACGDLVGLKTTSIET